MKKKIILGAIIFLILSGAFYWFQWRPAQIRKECSRFINLKVIGSWRTHSAEEKELDYKECLREHGLEK